MDEFCVTRLLKNARFLQRAEIGALPEVEPPEGFGSMISLGDLRRLHMMEPEEARAALGNRPLARRPPRPGIKAVSPLFAGTLRFVQATFVSSGVSYAVPPADQQTAVRYATLAAVPISQYASQYGPNSLALDGNAIAFQATLAGGKYNDQTLSGWTDRIAQEQGLKPDSCLAFLNPVGVKNTDADASQGVLGYHNVSGSGVPYIFVNVMGKGLTVRDEKDVYAVALSHEMAEMTVDPRADESNPEISDDCSGNCNVDHRDYFGPDGAWVGGAPTKDYAFFIDGIVKPESVSQCPAPTSACVYPPPDGTRSAAN